MRRRKRQRGRRKRRRRRRKRRRRKRLSCLHVSEASAPFFTMFHAQQNIQKELRKVADSTFSPHLIALPSSLPSLTLLDLSAAIFTADDSLLFETLFTWLSWISSSLTGHFLILLLHLYKDGLYAGSLSLAM